MALQIVPSKNPAPDKHSSARRGHLRLVYDNRRRPGAQRDGLSEAEMRMRWYARNIRTLRDGLIDFDEIEFAGDRPKLKLVTEGEDR